jgi:hypothetical protein
MDMFKVCGYAWRTKNRSLTSSTPSRIKSIMRQGQIDTDIDTYSQMLDTYALKFQVSDPIPSIALSHQRLFLKIASPIELNRQRRRMDLHRYSDQEEVKEMFVRILVMVLLTICTDIPLGSWYLSEALKISRQLLRCGMMCPRSCKLFKR